MLDLAFLLLLLAGAGWIAWRAFQRPRGVYLRSLLGFAAVVGAALGLWALGDPLISDAGGLGAFLIFVAVSAFAGLVALAACLAATLRHALDALARRGG